MDQIQKFLVKYYHGIGTARGRRLARLARTGQLALLQKESVGQPQNYQNASSYRKAAWATELLRKTQLPSDAKVRYEAAVNTFWECEHQCARTNAYLDRFIDNKGPFGPSDEPVIHLLEVWRKEIKSVLGGLPHILTPRFSKGATLSDKGLLTTIPDKMSSEPTLYPGMYDIYAHSISHTVFDRLTERTHKVVRCNRFFTVPKDSLKDRGCCVEASGALGLQLDIGRILKERYMKRYQVDLSRESKALHMRLAQLASEGALDLATIDLSNASDTVSHKLIRLLLPGDWFALLNSLRATHTDLDGKQVRLEKFSSMGNGFTFELETILFKTLLVSLGARQSWAFGDDMIVDRTLAPAVISALQVFGFTPNVKKTFIEGPFRESCGGDYFLGEDVRAFYLDKIPVEPQQWMEVANGLRVIDPHLRHFGAAWWFCVDQVPASWRLFGPSGTVSFHVPEPPTYIRIVNGYPVPHYKVKRVLPRTFSLEKYWKPNVVLAAAVLGVGPDVTPRGMIQGYRNHYLQCWGLREQDPFNVTVK